MASSTIGVRTKQFAEDEIGAADWSINDLGLMVPQEGIVSADAATEIAPSLAADAWLSIRNAPFGIRTLRPYLIPLYDLSSKYPEGSRNITIMAGRQVEKCVVATEPILMADGTAKPIKDVKVGDRLASMIRSDVRMGVDTVLGVSDILLKKCLKITTATGRVIQVATTHPIRIPEKYINASEIAVGDHIAVCFDLGARKINKKGAKYISNVLINKVLSDSNAVYTKLVSCSDIDRRIDQYVRRDDVDDGVVDKLAMYRDADIGWEIVVSIEDIGRMECIDLEMRTYANFVVNGVITHNSSTLAAMSIVYGAMSPYLGTLYVAPRESQVTVYSRDRFAGIARESPIIAQRLMGRKEAWQVFDRGFTNGSAFYFRAALTSPDASRSITAMLLQGDEVQEIEVDFIPVIEQCQSRWMKHPLRKRVYSGTPLSHANTLSLMYNESCQFRWKMRCGCGYWNDPMNDGVKMLSISGYVCAKCGKGIDNRNGIWIPERPELLNVRWGFHLSQIIVPFKDAAEIIAFRDDPKTSETQFFNESLGIPCDTGRSLLSREDVLMACEDRPMMDSSDLRKLSTNALLYGGVDYGLSRDDGSSAYTFLVIGGPLSYASNVFKVYQLKRLTGAEGDLSHLEEWLDRYFRFVNIRVVGADEGFGTFQNTKLTNQLGWSSGTGFDNNTYPALLRFMYVGSHTGKFLTYKTETGIFSLNRSQAIISLVDAIKRRNIRFPNQTSMEPYMNDLTALHGEYNNRTRHVQYVHSVPDDGFHALAYAYLTFLYQHGKLVPAIL